MEPSWYLAFMYGFVGSLGVELILIQKAMGPRGGLPAKYRTKVFWGVRIVMALMSGVVATAYYSPLMPFYLYIHLGAATPAILTRVSQSDGDKENGSDAQDDDSK